MSEDKTKEDNKKQADKDKPKINLNDSQMYDFICNLLKKVEDGDGDLFNKTPKSVKKLLAIHTGGLDPRKSHRWIFYNSTVFASAGLVSLFIPTKGTPFTPIGTLSIMAILGLAIDGILGACSAFPNIRYFNKLKKYQKELEKLAGFEFEITDNDTYFAQIALITCYYAGLIDSACQIFANDHRLRTGKKLITDGNDVKADLYLNMRNDFREDVNKLYSTVVVLATNSLAKIIAKTGDDDLIASMPLDYREKYAPNFNKDEED